mmetsp:Transcript_21084/g.25058  ORF Transcript_21084/g.25058 Transcript_21084/m.25058 type:complete len:211 (-) Transcript_21084:74-706(-)
MVKHNNVIPNIHNKKKYLESSRGPLKVRLSLNQATKKKTRRLTRAAKAARIAPRPLSLLRPAVQSQTQRYSSKTRLGRGFTLQEIKAAGLTPRYARTVGIAVDHRRINRSEEGLKRNVDRLTEYKLKLIVFPRRRGVFKSGDSSAAETKAATQLEGRTILPLVKKTDSIEMMVISKAMKEHSAFTQMRVAAKENKVAGHRISVIKRKEKK